MRGTDTIFHKDRDDQDVEANQRGIDLANKVMLMAACALNLKKLIKKKIQKENQKTQC